MYVFVVLVTTVDMQKPPPDFRSNFEGKLPTEKNVYMFEKSESNENIFNF